MQVLGNWLEESGWTTALVTANIASPGIAGSFVHATHVTRTRNAHQVTVATLYELLDEAYDEYSASEGNPISFKQWYEQRAKESVHFDFWLKTLDMEISMLLYVRSLREGDFQLYVQSLEQLIPWMFALDHTHCARWLTTASERYDGSTYKTPSHTCRIQCWTLCCA